MNFKLIFLFFLLLNGCGVKGPPRAPKGTEIPFSYQKYLKGEAESSQHKDSLDESVEEE